MAKYDARVQAVHERIGNVKYMTPRQAHRLARHFDKQQPKRVLEIGTFHGAGACYLAALLPDGGHVYTIDKPWSAELKPQPSELLSACNLADRVDVVRRNDGAEGFIADWQATRPGERFDFVYLDGGHTLEATAAQLSLAWSVLGAGGWLLVDDIDNHKYQAVGHLWSHVVKALTPVRWAEGNWGFAMKCQTLAPDWWKQQHDADKNSPQ